MHIETELLSETCKNSWHIVKSLALGCFKPVKRKTAIFSGPSAAAGAISGLSASSNSSSIRWDPRYWPACSSSPWSRPGFIDLPDGLWNTILAASGRLPTPQCEIFIGTIQGAANRIPADATAYFHRNAKFVINVHGRWNDLAEDERGVAWARELFMNAKSFASAGGYVN
jgi:hypothetical protein